MSHKKEQISEETMKDLYTEQGLNCYEIAELVGLPYNTVSKYKKRYGIPTHPIVRGLQISVPLLQEFAKNGLTVSEMTKKLNEEYGITIDKEGVRNRLNKHKIEHKKLIRKYKELPKNRIIPVDEIKPFQPLTMDIVKDTVKRKLKVGDTVRVKFKESAAAKQGVIIKFCSNLVLVRDDRGFDACYKYVDLYEGVKPNATKNI